MIENMTGPTEMLSNSPRVIPFSKASIITGKYKITETGRGKPMNDYEKLARKSYLAEGHLYDCKLKLK
jgi:hypothetical protein